MQKRTSVLLHLLLVIIVFVELAGRFTNNISLEYPVKPLIMIWMAAYFLIFRKKKQFTVAVLVAFFFSWVGDNFLMFSGKNELFFYAGVGSFFFAQLTYIYTFARYSETGGRGFLQKHLITGFLFIVYVAGIYYLLYPNLEGMMRPIIFIYALSLIVMSMMALNRHGRVNYPSYLLVFIGSVLFVISDSMIALNKFYMEIPLAGFWIMITYISAQYLILRGLILER
ncbi:MAG: lysoplasmalogenase [Bacteroidales bacterium]|nr:lysoplasmalogenase [Bacteroidales bacterium]